MRQPGRGREASGSLQAILQFPWVQEMEPVISVAARGMAETLIFYIVSASQLMRCRICGIPSRGPASVLSATEGDGRVWSCKRRLSIRPFRLDRGIHICDKL